MNPENYIRIGSVYVYYRDVLTGLLEYVEQDPKLFSVWDGERLKRAGETVIRVAEQLKGKAS